MELLAAPPARDHEVRLLEHAEVLHHPEARHRELPPEFAERLAVPAAELVEELPPGRRRQRSEDHVLVHITSICDLLVTCQESECRAMTFDVKRLTANNPGPMTLEGTNTYLVGRDPTVVIDPGPDDPGHIEAVRAEAEARGGIGTVLLTHEHGDHTGGVAALGIEPAGPSDGDVVAGLETIATPGHSADHLCFLLRDQ